MDNKFLPGKQFRWNRTNFKVHEVFSEGKQVRLHDMFTGERKIIDVSILVAAFFKGEIRFAVEEKLAKPAAEGEISTEYQYRTMDDCPKHLAEKAEWKLRVIEPLLDLPRTAQTETKIEERIAEVKENMIPKGEENKYRLTVSTIRRWIRDYEGSGRDPRSLIDYVGRRGGRGKSRLNERVDQIIEEKIKEVYLKERVKTTAKDVKYAVAAQIKKENEFLSDDKKMEMPDYTTITRRIAKLDPEEVYTLRHGREATRKKFKQFGQMEYPELPLERVEIDHTLLDLIILDLDAMPLGRLTFTYCIDTASRFPLGYYLGFEPPSYLTVMECLKHAIMQKNAKERYGTENEWLAYGIPTTLVIDNGKEFVGEDLKDACGLLGVILERTGVRSPWQKPVVERFFRTTAEGLIHTLPGTTFSNIFQKGDYKSTRQACIFVDDIDRLVNIFLLDFYAQRFHRGLKAIPARYWDAMTGKGFFPRLPSNTDDLTIILCPFDERRVWHYGVDFEGLRYDSRDLVYLRTELGEQKTKIKYNPSDLSQIYVHNPFDGSYITVPALAGEYAQNLSLWKHKVIKRVAQQFEDEEDLVALWRARQQIQDIILTSLDRKQKINRRVARYLASGKSTSEFAAPQIIDIKVSESPPPPQLPTPPAENTPLFSLSNRTKEGWEVVKGGLSTREKKDEEIENE